MEREQKIQTLEMSWLMETGTLTRTCQQLDSVLFPLILANRFLVTLLCTQ